MEEFEQSSASSKTKTTYVPTVISITLVLLLSGMLGLILVHAKKLSSHVKENMVLNVMVNEDAKEDDILNLRQQINQSSWVRKTDYISKEQAARTLSKDLGEDFVEFLGQNPLLPSLDVYLNANYADTTHVRIFSTHVLKKPFVKEVVYQPSLIGMVDQNIQKISLIILGFTLVLLVVSVTLINNTIRVAIHSQRFLIKSMQLVGATKAFIRAPFLKTGILQGLLAGLIAAMLLCLGLYVAQRQIPELVVLSDWREFGIVLAVDVAVGMLIAVSSTYLAVSKYLRLQIFDLYR